MKFTPQIVFVLALAIRPITGCLGRRGAPPWSSSQSSQIDRTHPPAYCDLLHPCCGGLDCTPDRGRFRCHSTYLHLHTMTTASAHLMRSSLQPLWRLVPAWPEVLCRKITALAFVSIVPEMNVSNESRLKLAIRKWRMLGKWGRVLPYRLRLLPRQVPER